jgi:golgi-specific brefeldin A-resistance guanine nucleotide exchange factor 1
MSDVALSESFEGYKRTVEASQLDIDGNYTATMVQQTWGSGEKHPSSGFDQSHRPTPISVAVDPVALITTECITVTSAMRKHARWAHSSVSAILGGASTSPSGRQGSRPATPGDDLSNIKRHKTRSSLADGDEDGGLANRWGLRGKKGKSMQDNPLMAGFGRLRRELAGCKGI